MNRRLASSLGAGALALVLSACGGTPEGPGPTPPPTPPPANALPSITSITAQGRRPSQPARFADAGETIDVVATVTDAETPLDELAYQWTATVGTFTGTGRTVTWTAPAAVAQPTTVTLTLKVVENYGHPGQAKIYSHDVSSTVTVALHDSAGEVGRMSKDFLVAFSQPQTIRDWQVVMKDFKRSVCPDPREYDWERESVEDHIANFVMHSYSIGTPSATVRFSGVCEYNLPGDACAAVRVMWNSTGPNGPGSTTGTDYLTAVYVPADSRWWLCSSRYDADTTFGHGFYAK